MSMPKLIIRLEMLRGGLPRRSSGLISRRLGMRLVSRRITINCPLSVRGPSTS